MASDRLFQCVASRDKVINELSREIAPSQLVPATLSYVPLPKRDYFPPITVPSLSTQARREIATGANPLQTFRSCVRRLNLASVLELVKARHLFALSKSAVPWLPSS